MPDSEFASSLRRFPRALGELLTAPRRALRRIEASQRGGFAMLVIWSLLAAVALRFANLADAVVGFEAGGGMRVVAVLVGELTAAIPVALGAAVSVVVLAGAKRDPGLDLELGCATAMPFLVTRAAWRTGVILVGIEPPPALSQASYVVGGLWTVGLLVLAVRLAHERPSPRPPEATSRQQLWSGAAGWGAIGVLAVGLAGSAVWTARNTSALGPVSRGALAPDFTLPRVDGQAGSLSLSSLRGRVVVLDFWATWCPPCLASLPMMHALSREMEPKGVTFVGVDSDGPQTSRQEVVAFLAEHGAPYPVVHDDGTANDLYRIKVLPTLVVVGRDGAVERVLMGTTSKGTLVAAIDKALSRP